MRNLYALLLLVFCASCSKKVVSSEPNPYLQEITTFQTKEKRTYMDALNVFGEQDFVESDFPFYPIDQMYKVEARLTLTPDSEVFEMPTSGKKTPRYRAYGNISFELGGESHTLTLYENLDLQAKSAEYADYLFCPFYDYTNGEGSYGGGRYLDFSKPDGDTLIVDFNKCYNPYCAYLDKFNCPITPRENTVNAAIPAGMMYAEKM